MYCEDGQASLFAPDSSAGKMSPAHSPAEIRKARILESFLKRSSGLGSIPYMFLDLSEDAGNLLEKSYWETHSPWRGDALMLNTGVSPREGKESFLWQILEERPHPRYYLTKKACLGILRRSTERRKELPPQLKEALEVQAGLRSYTIPPPTGKSYHINQRNEGIDLGGISGALMATQNMQMQTFVTQSSPDNPIVLDGCNGDLPREAPSALGTNCGMSSERNGVIPPSSASILCLNDQGGQFMHLTENVSGTLRAEEHGHQPILLESTQNHASIRTDGISTTLTASMGIGNGCVPMVYENHGIDSRYTGPLEIAPTMSARYGTGGNNVPLVEHTTFCIIGNIIDRQPENGGNGMGYQNDVAYTLTATDRHAVFSRQRVDVFQENDMVSTESARQHKDATDLVVQSYQQTVGTLGFTDHKGINNQYVSEDKCVIESANLIRRLTPLECERLQGFPDHWTDIPDASDSVRYKALGNSVAIPCVDYVVNGMAVILRNISIPNNSTSNNSPSAPLSPMSPCSAEAKSHRGEKVLPTE